MTTNKRRKVLQLLGSVVTFSGVTSLAALGASASTTVAAKPNPATLKAIGPAKATGKTLSLARGKPGIFLIGPNGRSLYIFTNDHGTKSACTGGCAAIWPALTATRSITLGPLVNKSEVGRADGQKPDQVTYYGHLLYYFSGDSAPGQTNGINTLDWHLLGPFGNVMLPRS